MKNQLSKVVIKKVNELINEGKNKTEIAKIGGFNNLQHLNQLMFDKWNLSTRQFNKIMLNFGMGDKEIMEHIQNSL